MASEAHCRHRMSMADLSIELAGSALEEAFLKKEVEINFCFKGFLQLCFLQCEGSLSYWMFTVQVVDYF